MSTISRVTASVAAVGVTMLAAAGALLASPVAAQADPTADETPGKLLLMLDASGSMKAKDPSGLTKIAAAKKALTSVVGALPADAQVGLRVYGATQPGVAPGVKPPAKACTDTQLVAPIKTLDKPGLTKAINGFAAKGETPIAYSLTQAMKDLGSTGKRNIVLVSDGEESCVPDPCPVIKKLVGTGIDLQIDTVGFGVNAKARQQLQCIATAGKGTYYDADNSDQLAASLTKLSQRAIRQFTVSGTPVKAAVRPEDAPQLTPGQYTDTFTTGEAARYYRITRAAGSTTMFSVTARPGPNPDDYNTERLAVSLGLPDGTECASESGLRFGGRGSVVTAVRARGPKKADDTEPCHTATELIAKVTREKGAPGAVPSRCS
ncbi:vWA domain-containing protein [Knoellia koreensis]|uniref:VWA domain-containing protein n=1 Tax=Knoellia koreensis TaxID=2730921 RepID=A0A849HPB1_9MICO|nr:VWA domain-containing protein [Knoellia sp. DB2414S]NNM46447.1 VWA domain-containing protein [Knoellia sp. DB2414S]